MIPNKFPTVHSQKRIAVIGYKPHAEDRVSGVPFSSSAGRLLGAMLGQVRVALNQCFLGLCDNGQGAEFGIIQLRKDLDKFKPQITILLGDGVYRLFYLNGSSIETDRGSLCLSNNPPLEGFKCIPTYEPSSIFRVWKNCPIFQLDLLKSVKHANDTPYSPPKREGPVYPSLEEVITTLESYISSGKTIWWDVEGYCDTTGVTELSLAITPSEGIVIPLWINGKHYWSLDDETIVWQMLTRILCNPKIPKGCQNALYETFIMAWCHGVIVQGITEDTMLKHFELYPEFKKSLGFQASIYTDEPAYKDERTSEDTDVKLHYNLKDSLVTCECGEKQEGMLSEKQREHYQFNVNLIQPMTYMMLAGCRFDSGKCDELRAKKEAELEVIHNNLYEVVGRKINVKSTNDKRWLLYEHFGYKPLKKFTTTTGNDGAAEDVILHYQSKDRDNKALAYLYQAIKARTYISDLNKLVLNEDGRIRCNYIIPGTVTNRLASKKSNARRASFTKKGLLKWLETGTNLQNVQKEIRQCFIPDDPEKEDFNQCDLAGADGWTVAADLAALGHPAMLDDYLYGLKPAKILMLMLELIEKGESPRVVNTLDRSEIKRRCDAIVIPKEKDELGRPGDWKYHCMKAVQHGTNYNMKPPTLCDNVFKRSQGLIIITPNQATIWQALYEARYNVSARTRWIERELKTKGYLETSVGFKRQFFGIRYGQVDDKTLREALAHEPQFYTTYVTNKASLNIYNSPMNKYRSGDLLVKLRLQIHDALCVNYPKRYRSFAKEILESAFNFKVNIHGIDIHIPAESEYGPNWYNIDTPLF